MNKQDREELGKIKDLTLFAIRRLKNQLKDPDLSDQAREKAQRKLDKVMKKVEFKLNGQVRKGFA